MIQKSRAQLITKLGKLPDTVQTRGHFKYRASSCHVHTMLECVIFAIIENGWRSLFQSSLLGHALLKRYEASRTKDKNKISMAFRIFFNGTTQGCKRSITRGAGHVGVDGAIQENVNCILGQEDEFDFIDKSKNCLHLRGQCTACADKKDFDLYKEATVRLENFSTVTEAIALWRRSIRKRKCRQCSHPMTFMDIPIAYPRTLVVEPYRKVQGEGIQHQPLPEDFQLELSVTVDGTACNLISVCYHIQTPLHFTGDALRVVNGIRRFCYTRGPSEQRHVIGAYSRHEES